MFWLTVPNYAKQGPGFPNKQSFWTRKMCWGIQTLVVGDLRHLICALDKDWHGGAHDSTIWSWSNFKPIIEQNREHLIAGNSAFAISDVLIKPYSNKVRIQAVLMSHSSYPFFAVWIPLFPTLFVCFLFFLEIKLSIGTGSVVKPEPGCFGRIKRSIIH